MNVSLIRSTFSEWRLSTDTLKTFLALAQIEALLCGFSHSVPILRWLSVIFSARVKYFSILKYTRKRNTNFTAFHAQPQHNMRRHKSITQTSDLSLPLLLYIRAKFRWDRTKTTEIRALECTYYWHVVHPTAITQVDCDHRSISIDITTSLIVISAAKLFTSVGQRY